MIYDTGGEQLKTIGKQYMDQCDAVIVIFDLSSKANFEKCQNDYLDLIFTVNNVPPTVGILGNKADLAREVDIAAGQGLCDRMPAHFTPFYMETSAKDGDNVSKMFEKLFLDAVKCSFR